MVTPGSRGYKVALKLVLLAACLGGRANAQSCTPLADSSREKLKAYVVKLAKVPARASVQLVSTGIEEGAGCYRRLKFVPAPV